MKKDTDSKLRLVCKECETINQFSSTRPLREAKCGKCKSALIGSQPINVNTGGLDKHIHNSALPVLVDFWAPWCGPCKMFTPTYESYAGNQSDSIRCLKLNTEDNQEAGAKFNIRSIPTLALFNNGKEINRVSGAMNEAQLAQWVKDTLASN